VTAVGATTQPSRMLDKDRLNLARIQVMLVDDNAQSLDIMAQIVVGFGARNLLRCASAGEARHEISRHTVDLILFDAHLPGESGYDFARWVRWEGPESVRFAPLVMITGHTPASQVTMARDCGINFVVAKPLVPRVLLQRLHWLAQDERQFIQCETYCGPDRRFKRLGPPYGVDGRRHDDLKGNVGEAKSPNMSQDEIDALMSPSKVAL
jgi:CheY-like chemotaxis protein